MRAVDIALATAALITCVAVGNAWAASSAALSASIAAAAPQPERRFGTGYNEAPLPVYDTHAQCRAIAGSTGPFCDIIMQRCTRAEQAAHRALLPRWAGVAPAIKRSCDEAARATGVSGSYQALQECVRQAWSTESPSAAIRAQPDPPSR